MGSRWYTFEDVMETDKDGLCKISRDKLSTCAFAQLRPGDIIGVTHTFEFSAGEDRNIGTLFVKVVSVKMPRPYTWWRPGFSGSVTVALPSGESTELLSLDPFAWSSGLCYFPSPRICEYFRENCEVEGDYVMPNRMIIYKGHEAILQEDMLAEKERRERVRAARIEQYQQFAEQREAEAVSRAEHEQRNADARAVLDELFDSMDSVRFSKVTCPGCKAVCEVPIRGKNVLIHCKCGKDFEIFC